MSRKPNNKFKFSNILCFFLIIPCFIFISFIQSFASTQVSLEWNPNSETDLSGYRAFSREESKSYDYTHPIWEGTTDYCTIYNLDETKNYYFVVRAFNASGFESATRGFACRGWRAHRRDQRWHQETRPPRLLMSL